jgi:hypothetical protein
VEERLGFDHFFVWRHRCQLVRRILAGVVTLRASLAPNEDGAKGSVSVLDNKTAAPYLSTDCTFSVQSQPPNLLSIAPGRVWACVRCPALRDPNSSDQDAICQIAPGFVVLENCAR